MDEKKGFWRTNVISRYNDCLLELNNSLVDKITFEFPISQSSVRFVGMFVFVVCKEVEVWQESMCVLDRLLKERREK